MDGLVKDHSNSTANALELLQSCSQPLVRGNKTVGLRLPEGKLENNFYCNFTLFLLVARATYRQVSNISRTLVGD